MSPRPRPGGGGAGRKHVRSVRDGSAGFAFRIESASAGASVAEVEQARDARRVVGRVGLALANLEGVLEAPARLHQLVDGARLVAVAHEVDAGQLEHRLVEDQRRILDARGIGGLAAQRAAFAREHAVSAVRTAAHDPIDLEPRAVCARAPEHEAATRIGIPLDVAREDFLGVGAQRVGRRCECAAHSGRPVSRKPMPSGTL